MAARGSGVLSTRYGKIEDLVLNMRVALAGGEVIETVEVPRHAVGPELTQLFVGSEGTLGVITQVTLADRPAARLRRFATVRFPDIGAGVEAVRRALRSARGRPSCACTTTRPRGSRSHRWSARSSTAPARSSPSRAATPTWWAPRRRDARAGPRGGRRAARPRAGQTWWDRRYDFYHPPHQPELPSIWGTIDVVATYSRIEAVYDALRAAVKEPFADTDLQLRMHFSHWYAWGTMIYARFVVPDGGGGPEAVALHDRIWEEGLEAPSRRAR